MSNFRTAALATATAAALALSGTGVALADTTTPTPAGNQADAIFKGTKGEGDTDLGTILKEGTKGVFEGKGASEFSKNTNGKTPFYGTDLFGKVTHWQDAPQWARLWVDGATIAGIGAAIGGIIAAVNYASYNGWIQLPQIGR